MKVSTKDTKLSDLQIVLVNTQNNVQYTFPH